MKTNLIWQAAVLLTLRLLVGCSSNLTRLKIDGTPRAAFTLKIENGFSIYTVIADGGATVYETAKDDFSFTVFKQNPSTEMQVSVLRGKTLVFEVPVPIGSVGIRLVVEGEKVTWTLISEDATVDAAE